MDEYAPPAVEEEEDDLTTPEEGVGEELPPSDSAETQPEPDDPLARLKALEQRIGTEDDVRTVKSQRDQLKAQLEQLAPAVEQMRARLSQLESQRTQDEDRQFESAWAQYIQAQPAGERQELARQQYIAMKAKRDADRRAAEIAAAQQAIATAAQEAQAEQTVQRVQSFFAAMAQEAGIDPAKLDMSSAGALYDSFKKEMTRLKELAQTTPPKPPRKPQHSGSVSQGTTFSSWFDDLAARGDWARINRVFRQAEAKQGLSLEELMRH